MVVVTTSKSFDISFGVLLSTFVAMEVMEVVLTLLLSSKPSGRRYVWNGRECISDFLLISAIDDEDEEYDNDDGEDIIIPTTESRYFLRPTLVHKTDPSLSTTIKPSRAKSECECECDSLVEPSLLLLLSSIITSKAIVRRTMDAPDGT